MSTPAEKDMADMDDIKVTDGSDPIEGENGAAAVKEPGLVDDNLVGGVVLFLIAAVFIGFSADSSMDWILPRMLSYFLILTGVILIVRGFLGRGRKVNIIPAILLGRGVDVFVFVVMVTAFVALARPVGFWLMAFLTMFISSLYLATSRDLKVILQSLAMATGVVIVGYLVLLELFFVPLDVFGTWWPF